MLKTNLKKLREAKELKPIDVAYHCKITEKYYRQLETEGRNPTMGVLIKLADFFGVSLDELVGRKIPTKAKRPKVMLPLEQRVGKKTEHN